LVNVISAALGGGGETPKEDRTDLAQAPSYDMALVQINNALSFG
jgi:hypothetical protein